MKILYVTTYDPGNVHSWSGLGFYIEKSLKDSSLNVSNIKNLNENFYGGVISKFKKVIYSKLLKKQFLRDRYPKILHGYSDQVLKKIHDIETDIDIVFSPGTIPISKLQTKKPIVFYTDATFAGMIDFYPEYSNLCDESIRDGNRMEQSALDCCTLAIYASQWAADTAIKYYDVNPDKVKVVPFGANILNSPDKSIIKKNFLGKDFDACKLLFLGVDWDRKGGEKALEVTKLLNSKGIRAELHVAGCTPPDLHSNCKYIINHGFISKKDEAGYKKLTNLFLDSHFLILPSQAECFGIVFAEASAYGLPALATNVGGIPTAISEGKNGFTFSLNSSAEKYCDCIEFYMKSTQDYYDLAESTYADYLERLNWDVAGKKIKSLLEEIRL